MEPDKPLGQSTTVWGAIAVLVAVILKAVLHLSDADAQRVADAVLTILGVVGPLVIIWGRYRIQKKINQAVAITDQYATPVTNPAPTQRAAIDPSTPAAGK